MSSRRGLLTSSRRRDGATATAAAASAPRRPREPAEIPEYEPPMFALDDGARDDLSKIQRSSETTKVYEKHNEHSKTLLSNSIHAINERLRERREDLEQQQEKRRKKGLGGQPGETEAALEKAVKLLEVDVLRLTGRLEAHARKYVDRKIDIEDEKARLGALRHQVEQQRMQRPQRQTRGGPDVERKRRHRDNGEEDEEEDGEEEEANGDNEHAENAEDVEEEAAPAVSVFKLLQEARQSKQQEYEAMTMYEKYAIDNDYVVIRQTLHDAQHGDDGVTMAHPKAWFDKDDRPVLSRGREPGRNGGRGDGDDSDEEELVVAREVLSFKCPLSLVTMTEPYSSKKCKHTFQKDAILEYLGRNVKQCPQTGCSQMLQRSDFFADDLMLRKIKRAEEVARRREEDISNMEADEDDAEEDDGPSFRPRKGKQRPVLDDSDGEV